MKKTCILPGGCPCPRKGACENHGICHQCIARHCALDALVACQRANAVKITSQSLTGKALDDALAHGLKPHQTTEPKNTQS